MVEPSKFKCRQCGIVIELETERLSEFIRLRAEIVSELRGQGIETREYGLSFSTLLSSIGGCCSSPDYIILTR